MSKNSKKKEPKDRTIFLVAGLVSACMTLVAWATEWEFVSYLSVIPFIVTFVELFKLYCE